jgi:predicted DNA repair protein MutK
MSLTPDQILSAQKANLETLFGLTSKAFEGVEKLVELNVTASRAALSEAAQQKKKKNKKKKKKQKTKKKKKKNKK